MEILLPREKLKKYGVDKLSDLELIALILKTGYKNNNVFTLSKKLLKVIIQVGIDNIKLETLLSIKGLGLSKSSEILASIELSRRLLKGKKTRIFLSPGDVANAMQDIVNSKKEHFVVFYLDSRNQEVVRDIISIGTVNSSLVHPREVFESAIKYNASSIIISHNHPSGDPSPSDEDLLITKKLLDAGEILGIELVDHVIVAKKNIFSFKNEKLIDSV